MHLRAFFVVALLAAAPWYGMIPAAQAQTARESEVEGESLRRLRDLEQGLEILQGRILVLEERIDALLGSDDAASVYTIPLGDSPVRGNPDAGLTLVVFGDYQSEYATRAQYAIDRLLEAYPNDLRIVYKHYPLRTIHAQAHDASLAAIAAMQQDRFWEMHKLLYRNGRVLEAALYPILAGQIGLDLVRFEGDRISLAVLEILTADEREAVRLGLRGVPALFLNGRRMRTWRYDYVDARIRQALELIRPG
ncbi:MAG: thioredoxin domain-containing protein [SAR324 cluster bacterium]|nr:thioredoxin domain-containing protein [SAR324 cluster bacterium]